MSTQTTAHTAAGASAAVSVQPGQSVTYSSTGTFTGYIRFQISRNQGASWESIQEAAVDTNLAGGTWKNESSAERRFRFQAFDTDAVTPWTGTCNTVLADNNDTVRELKDSNGRVYAYVTDDGVVFNGDINLTRHVYSQDVITSGNVGVAAAGTTAVEYGDGRLHQTVLTVATTLPAIAGGANLAVGKLLYTLPAGAIVVESAYMSLGITQTQGNINANTPDGGLGTVIGSGAVATLDGTPTFENIITGQTFDNCTGTAEVKTALPTAGVSLVIEASAAHTIHFNAAALWAAGGDAAAILAGTVVINWRFMA